MTQARLESILFIQIAFPAEISNQIVFHSHHRLPEDLQREINAVRDPFNFFYSMMLKRAHKKVSTKISTDGNINQAVTFFVRLPKAQPPN